jgi:hypothetical protein
MVGVEEHERRRPLLSAALGFAMLETRAEPPALTTLKGWLNSWAGIGAIIGGMTRQGFNVEVRQFPQGWRVNFYPAGLAHSVACGSAWEPTPGQAALVSAPVAGQ